MRFWLHGQLVDAGDARVSVLDHGFTVGDGVFETLKVVAAPEGRPRPFALDRHLARLSRSAAGLGLAQPDTHEVRAAVLAVCDGNPELLGGGRLRITLTSGAGPLGSDRGGAPPTLAVTASQASVWPPTTRLAMSPWPRNESSPLRGLKTTSYADNVIVLAHAKSLGADEALLPNLAGDLCEGTGSNVFVVLDGVLRTPPLSSGCLAGVTRDLTIQWCREAGVDVLEQDVPLGRVGELDEVFVTSSTRDVHPVVEILGTSGESLWARPAGPMTARAATCFAKRSAESWNP